MLRPEVIRDLDLGKHGLKMVACEPGVQSAFEDGTVVPWWTDHDRTVAEFAKISPTDAKEFDIVHGRLEKLARYLQPYFLEEPPDLYAKGWKRVREGRKAFKRFRSVTGDEISDLIRFSTGSLGDFVERHYESREDPAHVPGLERVRHARAAVPTGHRDRADVPHALGRRRRGAGLLRPRDGRHGGDHPGDGERRDRRRRRDPHERARGADRHARGTRDRRGPGGRHRDHGAHRGVQRRPEAHLPGPGRAERPERGLPRGHRRDQDGRPVRQGELRPERRAAVDGHARRRRREPPLARHAGAHLRGGPAHLRPASVGRDARRAVGRLRHRVERRSVAGARGQARDDGVRAVRALRAARGRLGLPASGAAGQGGRAHRAVRARVHADDRGDATS